MRLLRQDVHESRHLAPPQLVRQETGARQSRSQEIALVQLLHRVFENILSFLGNQTLTKLQMITGELYTLCEPQLASCCCKCENDNPVILNGLCTECESQLDGYMPRTIKEVAKNNYGVKDKDFRFIPCEVRKRYTLFDRQTLENFMVRTCGSKMEWLRYLVKKDTRKKKLNATLQRKEEEADAFLEELAPGFVEASDRWWIRWRK